MFYISIIVIINGAKVFILWKSYNKYNINILLNISNQLKNIYEVCDISNKYLLNIIVVFHEHNQNVNKNNLKIVFSLF